MRTRNTALVVFLLGLGLLAAIPGQAAPPWLSVFSFSSSDGKASSTPAKPQELSEKDGPWLILATSFSGPEADRQASELVQELRSQFGYTAFVHHLQFEEEEVFGLGVNERGEPRKFQYKNPRANNEVAVMIGNFNGVEDPNAQKALKTIKTAKPACLNYEKNKQSGQQLAELRYWQRKMQNMVSKDVDVKTRGPMGNAFITRNPLMPEEMFTAQGLDPFLVEMNQDQEHTLLSNKGKYTVKIASFKGVDTLSAAKYEELAGKERKSQMSKIDEAAEKAKSLTAHLRSKGYEAYVFHDTTESIVCVGSFNDVGTPRLDGKMEINPAILKVMQQFGPTQQALPGQSAKKQLQPRIIKDMVLDYQPMPVEVPRKSLAAQYSPTAMRR